MCEWRLRLAGPKFELQWLATQLGTPEHMVLVDQGEYYLSSTHFAGLADAASVKALGAELTARVNGVMKLADMSATPVSFGGYVVSVDDDGQQEIFAFPPKFTASVAVMADAIVVSETGESPPRRATSSEVRLSVAAQDTRAAKALRLFGRDHTWDLLYKMLDVIEEDAGSGKALKAAGWVPAAELDRFTHTANNALAVGDAARHGHEKWAPPANPMSLEEAEDLLRALLLRWLASKGAT